MIWAWIVIGIGIFFFLFGIFLGKYRAWKSKHNIDEYAQKRNELTTRKKKEEPKEESSYGGFSLSSIIGGFISILIGVSLIKPISEQVLLASNQPEIAGTMGETVLKIVPGFFAIAILGIGVAVLYSNLRNAEII